MRQRYKVRTIKLGRVANTPKKQLLELDDEAFKTHLYIVGASRTGKTKQLENILRQIIMGQRHNGPGLLLLDPHGTLYNDLIRYFASHPAIKRPILCVDPSRDDFVVPYNILRKRIDDNGREAEPSVVARQVLDTLAYAWGAAGTQETPTFHRMASNLLHTLYLKQETTNEAFHYLQVLNRELRQALTENIERPTVSAHWQDIDSMTKRELREAILSTLNRFEPLVSQPRLTRMFGHPDRSIDFRRAMDEGWIILCNLSTEGSQIAKADGHLLGTLLLADLWATARDRGKASGRGIAEQRPFVVAIDEFQHFITPTIADNLSEASGFGLRLILAHQYPGQITVDPKHKEHGELLMRSILTNARNKIVFGGLGHDDDIGPLVDIMFRGVWSPERIKDEIYSTKVLDYKLVMQKAYARSTTETDGGSDSTNHGSVSGSSHSAGQVSSTTYDADGNILSTAFSNPQMDSVNSSVADSLGHTDNWSKSVTETEIESPMLMPVLGKEVSNRQFYSLEEQRYLSIAALYAQEQRQCVIRLADMDEPMSVFTPWVEDGVSSPDSCDAYIAKTYSNWPDLVLPADEAERLVELRRKEIEEQFSRQVSTRQLADKRDRISDTDSMETTIKTTDIKIHVEKIVEEKGKKKRYAVELNGRDVALLRDVFDSRFITIHHAGLLHFAKRRDPTDAAKTRLRPLVKVGLLKLHQGQYGMVHLPSGGTKEIKQIYGLEKAGFDVLVDNDFLPEAKEEGWSDRQRARFAQRSESTLKHEVGVLSIKAALRPAVEQTGRFSIREFGVQPYDYQFDDLTPSEEAYRKPDGFIDVVDEDSGQHHYFYLEFDHRRSEDLGEIVAKAKAYRAHLRKGGFLKFLRVGGAKPEDFPFRTLFVVQSADSKARRNNILAKLAELGFQTQIPVATFEDLLNDPLGAIWTIPAHYRAHVQAGNAGPAPRISLFEELSTEEAPFPHSAVAEIVLD